MSLPYRTFELSASPEKIYRAVLTGELSPFFKKAGMFSAGSMAKYFKWKQQSDSSLLGKIGYFRAKNHCVFRFRLRCVPQGAKTKVTLSVEHGPWSLFLMIITYVLGLCMLVVGVILPFIMFRFIKRGQKFALQFLQTHLVDWDLANREGGQPVPSGPPALPEGMIDSCPAKAAPPALPGGNVSQPDALEAAQVSLPSDEQPSEDWETPSGIISLEPKESSGQELDSGKSSHRRLLPALVMVGALVLGITVIGILRDSSEGNNEGMRNAPDVNLQSGNLAAEQTSPNTVEKPAFASDDERFSAQIIGDDMDNRQIQISKNGSPFMKIPAMGYLLAAYWSPGNKYVAINERNGNSGDYLWIVNLQDKTILKQPADDLCAKMESRSLGILEPEAKRKWGQDTHVNRYWVVADGWAGEEVLSATFSVLFFPQHEQEHETRLECRLRLKVSERSVEILDAKSTTATDGATSGSAQDSVSAANSKLIIGKWLERKFVIFHPDGKWGVQRHEGAPIDYEGRGWSVSGDQLTRSWPDGTGVETIENLDRQELRLRDASGNVTRYEWVSSLQESKTDSPSTRETVIGRGQLDSSYSMSFVEPAREIVSSFEWIARFGAERCTVAIDSLDLSAAKVGEPVPGGAFEGLIPLTIPLKSGNLIRKETWQVSAEDFSWSQPPDATTKVAESLQVMAKDAAGAQALIATLRLYQGQLQPGSDGQTGAAEKDSNNVDPFPGEKFPDTRQRLIEPADLSSLTKEELRYAINEMFARHGANFGKDEIRQSFVRFPWYRPRPGVNFDEIEQYEFSETEKANLKTLGAARDDKSAGSGNNPASLAVPPPTRSANVPFHQGTWIMKQTKENPNDIDYYENILKINGRKFTYTMKYRTVLRSTRNPWTNPKISKLRSFSSVTVYSGSIVDVGENTFGAKIENISWPDKSPLHGEADEKKNRRAIGITWKYVYRNGLLMDARNTNTVFRRH